MEDYLLLSDDFQKRLGTGLLSRKDERYFLFRMASPLMQAKLSELIDLKRVPKTFIHGNPHLDNYVKTIKGSAMMDFDRSRIGPYCWDIIRFLVALTLRREKDEGFLDRKVVDYFIDGYTVHFLNPEIPSKQLRMLKAIGPEKWQATTRDYLKANKKWAKKIRDFALDPKNPEAQELLKTFLKSINEENLIIHYKVNEIGLVPGSFGKMHFIFALSPKNPDSHLDSIILDIKEVYEELDTTFFYSPVNHHGERMILASKIYADGFEERVGFCTYQNKQFWGRQIPSFSMKVKKYLNEEELMDFAYSVASELGKGHRKGLLNPKDAELVEKDFTMNFDQYFKVSMFLAFELDLAYEAMRRKIKLYNDFKSW